MRPRNIILIDAQLSTRLSRYTHYLDSCSELARGQFFHVIEVELGFEICRKSYALISKNKPNSREDFDRASVEVYPWGLFIDEGVDERIYNSAMERFGEHYFGCVHQRPIVLKNSKFWLLHFCANFHCVSKLFTNCTVRAMTASHIAKPLFWPTPWPKFPTASQRTTFSPVFGKTGVFQHNQPNL